MEGRRKFTFAVALLLGFGLGWLVRPLFSEPVENSTVEQLPQVQLKSIVALEPVSNKDTLTLDASVQPRGTAQEESTVVEIDDLQGIEPLENEFTIDTLLALLRNGNRTALYGEYGAHAQFINNPELVTELLNHFLDLTDPQARKSALEMLMLANKANGNFVERQIVERMRQGERPSEWLSLLANTGVYTATSLDFLSEQLSYNLQGVEISDAMKAINRGTGKLFNNIPGQTRESLTTQIANHIGSDNPQIRGEAIQSLAAFPIPNSESILVNALRDDNNFVKQSAVKSLMRGEFHSPEISNALIAMMNDTSNTYEDRVRATYALRRYNLQGQDYDDVYNFNLELKTLRERSLSTAKKAKQESDNQD